MVSLSHGNIGAYIGTHTTSSILLKSFCIFLFKYTDDILSEEEKKEIKQSQKNYKHISAQGYALNRDKSIVFEFCRGIEWLIGRGYSENDAIVYDDISLLGIIIGINLVGDEHINKKAINWIHTIISLKHKSQEQIIYAKFLNNFLEKKSGEISGDQLDLELSLFNRLLQNEKLSLNNDLSDYFLRLRIKPFPYFKDDFFRTMVNVYIENKIIEFHILNQEEFNSKIELAQKEQKEKISMPIKTKLDHQAKNFASFVFLLIIIVILSFYSAIAYIIHVGDWNFYEPKTFILLGIPLLSYTINCMYIYIWQNELQLSPIYIYNSLFLWKQKKLYKDFFME
jgi:hypothetical protein